MNKINTKPTQLSTLSTNDSTTLRFDRPRISIFTESTINPTETFIWDRTSPCSHSLELGKIKERKKSFSKNQDFRNLTINGVSKRESGKFSDKDWSPPLRERKKLKNGKETIVPHRNGMDFKLRILQTQRNNTCNGTSPDKKYIIPSTFNGTRKLSVATPKLRLRKQQLKQDKKKQGIEEKKEMSNFGKRMEYICEHLSEQNLFKRLSIYSQQTMKSSLRIYKEDLQKIIAQRYGKDRISTFLDFEYIEDYNSMLQRMNELMKFNVEEVQILAFCIMDQNRDGLITPQDILSLIGAKKQMMTANYLVMEDINQIIKFMKQREKNNECIIDVLSNKYKYLKQEGLTLARYRTMNYQRTREQADLQAKQRKNKLITTRMHQYLYTLTSHHNESSSQNNLSSIKTKNICSSEKNAIDFAINFQTFQQVFQQGIPQTFIDVLYLIGGLEVPKVIYDPIDASVLKGLEIAPPPFFEHKTVEKIKQIVRKLKQFNKNTPTIFSTF